MKAVNNYISDQLNARKSDDSLRALKTETKLVDFCSNDYLGFSRSVELKKLFEEELEKYPEYRLGSGGSRLLAGNDRFTEDLEHSIASFHQSEASLLFNSGYDANVGIFASLPQRGDTIICDEYIHASIIDGARLSHAARYIFKHNDMDSLEDKLKLARGKIFIGVESIYSMDGDEAPLEQLCVLAEKYNAALIVDEAHAIGVFGDHGKGIVHTLNLHSRVFARTITFGKALGVHGAAVLGSAALRSYLINYARPFIYTTAPSFIGNLAIKTSYDYLGSTDHQKELHDKITLFSRNLKHLNGLYKSKSAIQILKVPGNSQAKDFAAALQLAGFDVRAILSPTVAVGSERLRICIHNHNSMDNIYALCNNLIQLCGL